MASIVTLIRYLYKGYEESKDPKKQDIGFWDSYFALALLVAAILFGRFYVAEPFKIPSGSMEPTLFGHEDYGDRIVTNKLAYESKWHCAEMAGIALALVVIGFFASRAYRRFRSMVLGVLIIAGTVAGFGFAFARDAVAGDPQRFDVVVFQYDAYWGTNSHPTRRNNPKSQKINYIKRLVGLPGDRIKIAGGDLWLYDRKEDRYKIVRKWDARSDALQDELWYPVALAWTGDVYKDAPADERERIAVPWTGAEKDAPGIVRNPRSLSLKGDADVHLEYAYNVSNLYIKQGRWPFKHTGCKAADDKGEKGSTGALFRSTDAKSEEMTSYIFHTWEGVQCPNCQKVMFPAVFKPTADPKITPLTHFPNSAGDAARFYYGGDHTVGDLRVDIDIDVEKSGSMTIEAGNSLHRAVWVLGSDGAPAETAEMHPVEGATPLTPGHHSISLAYVDATVISRLDGVVTHRLIDTTMPGHEADSMSSIARVSFSGVKGTVTRLDLYRDLHYTAMIMGDGSLPASLSDARENITDNQSSPPFVRGIDNEFRYFCDVPPGHYLMMGDNSPSSSDGRVWGFVPRENLVGRASFIAWPLSRARLIK